MRLLRRVVRRQDNKNVRAQVFSREDRHRFPKKLTRVRTGREIGYNLEAVIQCMLALLADEKRPWLPDRKFRNMILRGIIDRARGKSGDLASDLQENFQAFLI